MGKLLFFDADGTLLDLKTGIPPDVAPALQRLAENGHTAFLCTGRSRCLVPPEIEALPLAGMITNMGAYIEYQGNPVYRTEVDPAAARRAVEIIRCCGLVPVLEGDDYMYYDTAEYTADIDWFAPYITTMLGKHWQPLTGNEDNLHISKISAKRLPGCREEEMCAALADTFEAVRHHGGIADRTVELVARGHSKGTAIRQVCAMLGTDIRDTLAFGDSNNDIAMLQTAHIGVAMGNSTQPLLDIADYVTDTLQQGGISKALTHFGLI